MDYHGWRELLGTTSGGVTAEYHSWHHRLHHRLGALCSHCIQTHYSKKLKKVCHRRVGTEKTFQDHGQRYWSIYPEHSLPFLASQSKVHLINVHALPISLMISVHNMECVGIHPSIKESWPHGWGQMSTSYNPLERVKGRPQKPEDADGMTNWCVHLRWQKEYRTVRVLEMWVSEDFESSRKEEKQKKSFLREPGFACNLDRISLLSRIHLFSLFSRCGDQEA